MKATATAHPNIALVKYWGKRDEALILPHQSSVSVTLGPLSVSASVEVARGPGTDEIDINGVPAVGEERARVVRLADVLRAVEGPFHCAVETRGDFPKAAGLASSAAAFAALAVAMRAALGLPRSGREESILARLGSGSACRSVQGGFCVWHRGTQGDGSDSFAEQWFGPDHWPQLRLLVAVVTAAEKDVKSRDGMRRTVETSPYYPAWVIDAEAEVPRARELIARRDLQGLGELAERNAWRMHATALGARPPLCYLRPETVALTAALEGARRSGTPVWFTLDAGPNPVLLTEAAHEERVSSLARECGAREVVRCRPGGDVQLSIEAPV